MSLPERETLADAAGRLRDALALQSPPPAVHQALRAAFAAARAAPRPAVAAPADRRAGAAVAPRWWAAAACAALLVVSTSLLLLAAPADPARRIATAADPTRPLAAARADAAFVAVAAAERWPVAGGAEGAAPAWLVPAEMSRERLAAWGLPFDPALAGEAVQAELLLRPSGEVLAVRVLHAAAER